MWTLESWQRTWWASVAMLLSTLWWSTRAQAFIPQGQFQEVVFQVEANTPRSDTVSIEPFLERWWRVTDSTTEGLTPTVLRECHAAGDLASPRSVASCSWQEGKQLVFWERVPAWWPQGADEVRSRVEHASVLPQPGEVIFGELNWAGSRTLSSNYTGDEWVELVNLTDKVFNLNGIRLLAARSADLPLAIITDVWMAPYGTVLVGASREPNTHLALPLDWMSASFVLPNTGSRLSLALADGTILDTVPAGEWQAGRNESGGYRASAQRFWPPGNGSDWSQWFHCRQTPESWCHPSKQRVWKPGQYTTYATPWQAGPWE